MTRDTKESETPKIGVSYTASAKDRIVLYSIWIAWGFVPFALIWSDAVPFGGQIVSMTWIVYLGFAVWFTARRFRKLSVNPPAPNPETKTESN